MRIMFPGLIVVLMLEGLVRKLYPDIGAQVLLVKDCGIIIIMAFLVVFNRQALVSLMKGMNKIVLILGAVVVALSFSSMLWLGIPSQMYLLGVREYFFYAAIMAASYVYFDLNRSARFMKGLFLFSLAVNVAAICQATGFISTPLLLPLQGSWQSHSSVFGDFVYISSIFDVPERFAAFNLFIFLASYALIRNRDVLLRWEIMIATFLLSLISLFISGRRVSFVVAVAFVVFDLLTERQSIRRRIAAIVAVAIAAFGGSFFLANYESTLVQVMFNREILDETLFYAKQISVWYLDALGNAGLTVGYFGLTSPGMNSIDMTGEVAFPDTMKLEGIWDKTLISMGVLGSSLLLAAVVLVIFDLRRKSVGRGNAMMSSVYYFILCLSIWNIKSGEFMVWAPFAYLLIGLFYKLSRAADPAKSGINMLDSRRAAFQNV